MSMEEKDEDAALMKTATSTTRSGVGKEEREGGREGGKEGRGGGQEEKVEAMEAT
jgi:hypothetical protein